MGSAMVAGLLKKKVFSPEKIVVFDRDYSRREEITHLYKIKTAANLKELVDNCNTCVLAVKPQDKEPVLNELRAAKKKRLVISIMAGVTISYLEEKLGEIPVIRAMPNLGIRVDAGMTFFCPGRFVCPADVKIASMIFGCLGEISEIKEEKIDVITAISGSGPAYFFLLMEMLLSYARKSGISEEDSLKMVRQTALSASLLSREESFRELRAAVTSKGGTTEAAINVLEEYGIRKIFDSALNAALERARRLKKI